nr:unnamed protein product [Digitaria exilis]
MPPWEPAKRAAPPVGGSGGSIEELPDSVLEHILGFLPSPEAVQTSVLARRWRHLWKSATGLRVGCEYSDPRPVEELRSLMNHLLIIRQGSPLEKCDLAFGDFAGQDDVPHVNLWFRQVVMCKAQRLKPKVEMKLRVGPTKRSGAISKHLKKVELKCDVVDVRVLKVLQFLSAFNIYR